MSKGLSDAEHDDLCICAELSAAGPATDTEDLLRICGERLDAAAGVIAAREAAARQAGREEVVARVEALADRWAGDAGIEGYINLGEAEDALRALVAEFAPDATSEAPGNPDSHEWLGMDR